MRTNERTGAVAVDQGPMTDPLAIKVEGDLNKALRHFKKRMNREGVMKEVKVRRFYEKPSVKKKRKTKEAEKRRRKAMRRVTARKASTL